MDNNEDDLGMVLLLSAIQSKIVDVISAWEYTSSETAKSGAMGYTELNIGLIWLA